MLEEEYYRRKIRMPLLLTKLLKVSKSVKDFPPLLECVTSIAHALVEDEREGNSEYIESSSMSELMNLNQTEAMEEHHEDSYEVPYEMVIGDASYSIVSSLMSTNLKSVIISDRFDFVGIASKRKLVRPIVWKVTEVYGKLERVVSMVYVLGNKLITVSDHCRVRLLVIRWSSNCVDFWIMGRSKSVVATTPLGSPFGNGVQSQLFLLDDIGLSIKQPIITLEMKILGIFSLRVGKLADNKISWSGNSGFKDGSEPKLDLSNGMHYALDYKQIGFPLTFIVIVLPFPILEYGDQIEEVNQLETAQEFVPKVVKIVAAMVSAFLMFQAAGVNVHYVEDEFVPTGICAVCVVGGERLLIANLLATNCYKSECLKRPDNWAFVENPKYFYIAGFFLAVSLDYIQLVAEQAIGINNVFSLNLSAPFSCEFFKDALEEVLPYMDFILGNETEVSIFSKVHGRVTDDVAVIALKTSQWPKAFGTFKRFTVIIQSADPIVATEEITSLDLTKDVRTIVGPNVMKIISAPSAVVIAYASDKKAIHIGENNVLIFNLGGTSDVFSLTVTCARFEELNVNSLGTV